jgi:hypothetical protein
MGYLAAAGLCDLWQQWQTPRLLIAVVGTGAQIALSIVGDNGRAMG